MINESTQDAAKRLLRPGVLEKENSLNMISAPFFHDPKEFEDFNNNFANFKTKGFANSNFPNYASNQLGFLSACGQSVFGPCEKHQDISQNPFINDLNSKKDISFPKKPIEYEFSNYPSNQNSALFQNAFNMTHSNLINPDNYLFFNNLNNTPILGEESRLNENDKNYKNIYSQNFIQNCQGNKLYNDNNFYVMRFFNAF